MKKENSFEKNKPEEEIDPELTSGNVENFFGGKELKSGMSRQDVLDDFDARERKRIQKAKFSPKFREEAKLLDSEGNEIKLSEVKESGIYKAGDRIKLKKNSTTDDKDLKKASKIVFVGFDKKEKGKIILQLDDGICIKIDDYVIDFFEKEEDQFETNDESNEYESNFEPGLPDVEKIEGSIKEVKNRDVYITMLQADITKLELDVEYLERMFREGVTLNENKERLDKKIEETEKIISKLDKAQGEIEDLPYIPENEIYKNEEVAKNINILCGNLSGLIYIRAHSEDKIKIAEYDALIDKMENDLNKYYKKNWKD